MPERRWLSVALGLAALLWVPALSWSASVVLTIAPEARVQGHHVTLGDVADVQGEAADLVARLRQVVLGQAPPTGVERQLSRNSIVTQLKHQGFAVQQLQFQGATQVRVTRDVQRLDPPLWTPPCSRLSASVCRGRRRTRYATFAACTPSWCPQDPCTMR